ncbi:hypothetical protein ACWCQP_37330 [Streptomyces chartreusis]
MEIVASDAALTTTETETLQGRERQGSLRRDELLDRNPPPSEGEVIWFTSTEVRDAMAALSRLGVGSQPEGVWPGLLLDLLMSPEARVPSLPPGQPASGWMTLEPMLRTASMLAVAPAIPAADRPPVWTLIACRREGLILVRTVEPDEITPPLARGIAIEIRRALGF